MHGAVNCGHNLSSCKRSLRAGLAAVFSVSVGSFFMRCAGGAMADAEVNIGSFIAAVKGQ
ncbi:hypothetical protein EB241_10970 [Erwinia psidii]|uniref:Uncharacterized protein n=1 Tax=Erwinia psidii TaxID=69224 RepID=A0A3N6UQL7_9GAMM|nr:hypothetical protein EB241_10970 [Erwinia psidii]